MGTFSTGNHGRVCDTHSHSHPGAWPSSLCWSFLSPRRSMYVSGNPGLCCEGARYSEVRASLDIEERVLPCKALRRRFKRVQRYGRGG